MVRTSGGETKVVGKRLKDVEISVPIAYGTIAFWLGRKASETQSHKWTVYVRGATDENIEVVVKRVVFQLHPSFNNPTRVVDSPPFELSECGWGEFEIAITLHFHNDVCDRQLNLFHHLKLYSEDETGSQSTKKPVVVESYDEIVFPDPQDVLFARVHKHPAVKISRFPDDLSLLPDVPNEEENDRGSTKDHTLSQWFLKFSEEEELLKVSGARQQVQTRLNKLRRQLNAIDGLPS